MYVDESTRREDLNEVVSAEDRTNAQSMAATARAAWVRAQAAREQASASEQQAQAAVAQAQVAQAAAQINLDRPDVRASVDGDVTNLTARVGDYPNPGVARRALIHSQSYSIHV